MAIEKEILDQLLAGRDPQELCAKDDLVDELKKALSERILNTELAEHLGSQLVDASDNHRNGSFDPQLIAKYQRRFPDFDDNIISMYARGMTVREIRGLFKKLYGIDVSLDLILTVTAAVLDEVNEWQDRPSRHLLPNCVLRCDQGQNLR